jgi:hypothetical protein
MAGKVASEELFIAQAVLQGEQEGARFEQRGQESGEGGVMGALQGDDDEVTRADGSRVGINPGVWQVEVAREAFEVEAVLPHVRVVAAEEEVDIMSLLGQAAAVVATDGASADDGDAGLGKVEVRGSHECGHERVGRQYSTCSLRKGSDAVDAEGGGWLFGCCDGIGTV